MFATETPFKNHSTLVVVFQLFPVAEKLTSVPEQISVSVARILTVGIVVTMVSVIIEFEVAKAVLVQVALLFTIQVIF